MEQPRLEDAETIRDGLDGGARPEPMPEQIGPYRIDGRLGSGGMGEVFLAWDDRLKRRVAIKRIRPDSGLTAVQKERFRREAQLAARLSHAAVVQVHGGSQSWARSVGAGDGDEPTSERPVPAVGGADQSKLYGITLQDFSAFFEEST